MKLKDALKNSNVSGKPIMVDCSRKELPKFFKDLGFKKGVEIGVAWGENITDYCKEGLEIYGVDPWDAHTDEDEFRKLVSIDGKYGSSVDGLYKLASERTKDYPNCKLMKMTSIEALEYFPDRSLDFVYIDGNHSFGYVAMDLMKWNRKVRKGGVIAGHDYNSTNPTTARRYRAIGNIVDAFAKTYDFQSWYVLRGDENFSYLFFKHW